MAAQKQAEARPQSEQQSLKQMLAQLNKMAAKWGPARYKTNNEWLSAEGFIPLATTYARGGITIAHNYVLEVASACGFREGTPWMVFMELLSAAACGMTRIGLREMADSIDSLIGQDINYFKADGKLGLLEDGAIELCAKLENAKFKLPKSMINHDDPSEDGKARLFERIAYVKGASPEEGAIEFKLTDEGSQVVKCLDADYYYGPYQG